MSLANDTDQYGRRIPRVSDSRGDNDKAPINHAVDQMQTSLDLVSAKNVFRQQNGMSHLGGTAARIGGMARRGELWRRAPPACGDARGAERRGAGTPNPCHTSR